MPCSRFNWSNVRKAKKDAIVARWQSLFGVFPPQLISLLMDYCHAHPHNLLLDIVFQALDQGTDPVQISYFLVCVLC
jgi:hypothetical protein